MTSPSTTRLLQALAANMRRVRELQGLTQEALAERMGLDARYVQRLERAAVNVTFATFCRVADALDVAPQSLLRPAKLQARRPGRPAKKRTLSASRVTDRPK